MSEEHNVLLFDKLFVFYAILFLFLPYFSAEHKSYRQKKYSFHLLTTKMNKFHTLLLFFLFSTLGFSQHVLSAWSQQTIENYTKAMYDEAQTRTPTQLLVQNKEAVYWSEVFLTLNASLNNYKEDQNYMLALVHQLTDQTETKLKGTSCLIIWDRIISGDLIFEGKGLVFENDLYTTAGRANQILQNMTNENFGLVELHTTSEELTAIQARWFDYLQHHTKPTNSIIPRNQNAKIPEIASLKAMEALIISLQDHPIKRIRIKNCLQNVYNLEVMPTDSDNPAQLCNPDRYTIAYLGILIGQQQVDPNRDATWWMTFWKENKTKLTWNTEKGFFEIKS